MREIAKNAEKQTPKEMNELYDQVVTGIATCAKAGMLGMEMTVEVPDNLSTYVPHIIGDLRGGGLTVDVIAYAPLRSGLLGHSVSLFITW